MNDDQTTPSVPSEEISSNSTLTTETPVAAPSPTPKPKSKLPFIIGGAIVLLIIGGFIANSILSKSGSSKNNRLTKNAGDQKNITLNMIGHWKGEDKREDYMKETIKEFEVKNPGVKVNLKWNVDFPTGRGGALTAATDQIKNNKTEWDIIWLEPFNYQPIATALNDPDWGKKHLVDFEQVPGFVESQKPFILSDPQYRNQMNGMLTGPYIEGFYQPLFYNKEVADQMGITIKDKGMTYDDFLGYIKAVDAYNKKNGTKIPAMYESATQPGTGAGGGTSTWNIFQMLFRSELSDLNEIKNLDSSAKKHQAVQKVFGSLEELSKYKPLIEGHEANDWFNTRYMVLDNKALFSVAGASWMYSHWAGIDATKTKKMYPVEMPVYREITSYMGGYNPMYAVMKNSPNKDVAIKLMMSYAEPTAAERWVRYAKAPSGVKGNVSQTGKGTDQFDKFITYISDKYSGNIYDSKTVDYVLGKKYTGITDNFTNTLTDIIDGKITAKNAYNKIVQEEKAVQ